MGLAAFMFYFSLMYRAVSKFKLAVNKVIMLLFPHSKLST